MKTPKQIDLNLDEVDALLKRVETGTLQDGDYQIIKATAPEGIGDERYDAASGAIERSSKVRQRDALQPN